MEGRTGELTAREREVLELVRAGRTNDEIAERLGITSDGVKYHVSQVLSKLGVSSRHEAVDAAFGARRRGWCESAVASAAMRVAAAGAALVVLAFVVVLLLGVLRSGDSDSPDVSGLTAETVVASAEQAVTRPGQVLHTRIEAVATHEGETIPYYSTELWVDAARETIRYEWRLAPESYRYDAATESTAIIAGKYSYIQDSPGKAYRDEAEPNATGDVTCAGVSSVWMAVLFSCGSATAPGPGGEPRIEAGEFRGRGAIVIAYGNSETAPVTDPPTPSTATPVHGLTTVTPGPAHFVWRIYLDADDYLPIGYTFDQSEGDTPFAAIEAVYENEFVPLDEEIAALLDPASIGYGVEDADALLDQVAEQVPVYWLGEEFAGGGFNGELVLSEVLVGEQRGGVQQTYAVGGELVYEAPERFPLVELFLWRKADWESFLKTREGMVLTNPECVQTYLAELAGGQSTVYLLSPLQFPDLGESPFVVPIETPGGGVPIGGTPAPPIAPTPSVTFAPAPNETPCNFERRQTALIDTLIGTLELEDVVVQVRQHGYAISVQQMQELMEELRAR